MCSLSGKHKFLTGFTGEQNVFFIATWNGALGVTCGWCSSFEKSIYDCFIRDVGCCSVSLVFKNIGRKYCGISGIRIHRGGYCTNSRFNIYLLIRWYTSSNTLMLIPARPQCTSITFLYYLRSLHYGINPISHIRQF